MHIRGVAVTTVGVVVAMGCAAGEARRVDPIIKYKGFDGNDRHRPEPFDLDADHFPGDTGEMTAYTLAKNSPEGRRRLWGLLRERPDHMYDIHTSAVLAWSSGLRGGLSLTQVALSGTAALLTGGATPRILSAAAALTGATNEIIRNEFYFKLFVPETLRQMDIKRREMRQQIDARLSGDTAGGYTVDEMIADIMEYHRRGSFLYGVLLLARARDDQASTPPSPPVVIAGSVGSVRVSDLAPLARKDGNKSADPTAWTIGLSWADPALSLHSGVVIVQRSGQKISPSFPAPAQGVSYAVGDDFGSGGTVVGLAFPGTQKWSGEFMAKAPYQFIVYPFDRGRQYGPGVAVEALATAARDLRATFADAKQPATTTSIEVTWTLESYVDAVVVRLSADPKDWRPTPRAELLVGTMPSGLPTSAQVIHIHNNDGTTPLEFVDTLPKAALQDPLWYVVVPVVSRQGIPIYGLPKATRPNPSR